MIAVAFETMSGTSVAALDAESAPLVGEEVEIDHRMWRVLKRRWRVSATKKLVVFEFVEEVKPRG